MLVGLSPGREENSSRKLFIWPSGDFLNELLRLAKIDRGSLYPVRDRLPKATDRHLRCLISNGVYITNIIKCHAPTYSIGQKEVDACAGYLDKQIEMIKSETIIPLGSIATQYTLGKYNLPRPWEQGRGLSKKRISEIHGQLFSVTAEGLFNPNRNIKIIPMFHPAAALRTPGLSELVKKTGKNYTMNCERYD